MTSLAEWASDTVERSRNGDQHATAWIRLLGRAADEGVATPQNLKAYEAIRVIVDKPSEPNLLISVDATKLLKRLAVAKTPDEQCGILAGLPLVGGIQALAIASAILAIQPFSPVQIARGFAEGDAASLALAPEIGEAQTVTECAAQWVGRIMKEAISLRRFRAGDFFHDPAIAWELGLDVNNGAVPQV